MKQLSELLNCRKTWLITGAAGFIGSHLLEALLFNNQYVIGVDNFITGKSTNIDVILTKLPKEKRRNFTFVEGDIRNLKICHEVTKGVDFVLHQAALGSVPRSFADPVTTNDINVGGFLRLLQAAEQNKVERFVYASSSSVYGDSQELPKTEETLGLLLSPYALTKRTNELYGQIFYRFYGLPTIGLRYFNVFGPRQDSQSMYAAVIPLWIHSLLKQEPCYINGDGLNSRDFCYVENVVQANILAALTQNTQAYGDVFNIAFGEKTTLSNLYRLLRQTLGIDETVAPLHREMRTGDIMHSLANIDKAKNILGYNPCYSLEDGLKITTQWAIDSLNS